MGHSTLGPSSAERWMTCSGSVALSQGIVEKSSEFADEGTAYHHLAAVCLKDGKNAEDFIDSTILVCENGDTEIDPQDHDCYVGLSFREFKVDRANADYVQQYIEYVRLAAFNAELWVEQEVPIDHLTEEEGGMGTADAIVWNADQRELAVIDLKFGRGNEVDAVDNYQMRMYALGAIQKYAVQINGVQEIRMVIIQPRAGDGRPKEWVIPVTELMEFGEKVKRASKSVWAALEMYNELVAANMLQGDVFDQWCDQYLLASEKACLWCKAKARCPRIAREVAEAAAVDFEDLTQTELPVVIDELPGKHPNQDLANKMLKCNLIEGWIKAVRAEVEAELVAGREVPHFKLVQGKKGNRQWVSDEQALALLKKMRLKVDEIYDLSLKSPTAITKMLKDTPKRLERVEALITQADGKLSVAHESDKREAVTIAPTAAGMEAEDDVNDFV